MSGAEVPGTSRGKALTAIGLQLPESLLRPGTAASALGAGREQLRAAGRISRLQNLKSDASAICTLQFTRDACAAVLDQARSLEEAIDMLGGHDSNRRDDARPLALPAGHTDQQRVERTEHGQEAPRAKGDTDHGPAPEET